MSNCFAARAAIFRLPHGRQKGSIEAPSDIEEPREPVPMEKQFDELDEVEKNRHRAAVARVIEMIESGSGGRYKVGGLDAYRRGEGTAAEDAVSAAAAPDV